MFAEDTPSVQIGTLNGLRVRADDGETGTIIRVYVFPRVRTAHIHVNMDSGGLRVFLPYHLTTLNGQLVALKLLETSDEK